MKIIQVVGPSGSGKTTFIEDLLLKLSELGPTATIKHLGGHSFLLEKGKDSTRFFDRGAVISAGIDTDKAVIAIRNGSLDDTLALLNDRGIAFVVIEGFKERPYPRIIIGDLKTEHCILRDPTVDTVIRCLHLFSDYNVPDGHQI
jgi:molybdopterin-guanine dinucleotide biosynthesis protein MobB